MLKKFKIEGDEVSNLKQVNTRLIMKHSLHKMKFLKKKLGTEDYESFISGETSLLSILNKFKE